MSKLGQIFEKRNIILVIVFLFLVMGLVFAVALPEDVWARVNSFYSSTIVPVLLGIEVLISAHLAFDKYQKSKKEKRGRK